MATRIKVFNETNHVHNVRMLMPNGNYTHRKLAKKGAFAVLTEDQFLDLWMTTRDFKGGFLSYEEGALTDDIKMALGLPVDEEEKEVFEPEFVIYKDEDLKAIIEGNTNALKKFIKDNSEADPKNVDELKRRMFVIAEKLEDISRAKSEAIEAFTGKSFKTNAENDKNNK